MVISDAMLKQTYVTAVKDSTGVLYDNLFDSMDGTGISFQDFVTKIDNKWKKKQTLVITNSLYSNGVSIKFIHVSSFSYTRCEVVC